MITIEENNNLVNIAVMGEFTIADFKQFEEHALYKLKAPGKINLLFDLRGMIAYTPDVAWEELKFFRREHNHDTAQMGLGRNDPSGIPLQTEV